MNNPHISLIHFLESLPLRRPFHTLSPYCNVTMTQFSKKTRFHQRSISKQLSGWSDRLSAESAFLFASKYLPGRTTILSNFDIYFDHSLKLLKRDRWLSLSNMYFLSRYESDDSINIGTQCGPRYIGSHDSFIFVPPLARLLVAKSAGLTLGMPGMENRLIHEFRRQGVSILNPCKSIRSWHSHLSGLKNDILPLANTGMQSGIVRPAHLIPNPTLDDLSQ